MGRRKKEALFLIHLYFMLPVLGEVQRTAKARVLCPGAKKPLQLVLEDLIGVIIYHVNRKVFLN